MEKQLVYLSLDTSNGVFFQYSKTALDGYVKVEKNGKSYYRRDCEIVSGTIRSVSERSRTMVNKSAQEIEVSECNLSIEDDNAIYVISFLRDSQTVYSSFMESLLTKLPNLKKDVIYSFKPFNFTPDGAKRALRGFSIVDVNSGEKVSKLSAKYTDKDGVFHDGELPEKKFIDIRGKWTLDQNDYQNSLYEIFEKAKVDFPFHSVSRAPIAPVVSGVKNSPTAPVVNSNHKDVSESIDTSNIEDEDGLPF